MSLLAPFTAAVTPAGLHRAVNHTPRTTTGGAENSNPRAVESLQREHARLSIAVTLTILPILAVIAALPIGEGRLTNLRWAVLAVPLRALVVWTCAGSCMSARRQRLRMADMSLDELRCFAGGSEEIVSVTISTRSIGLIMTAAIWVGGAWAQELPPPDSGDSMNLPDLSLPSDEAVGPFATEEMSLDGAEQGAEESMLVGEQPLTVDSLRRLRRFRGWSAGLVGHVFRAD